jgi:hypothetical protein
MFKNLVRTSKKTPHFTITKITCLTLFKGADFALCHSLFSLVFLSHSFYLFALSLFLSPIYSLRYASRTFITSQRKHAVPDLLTHKSCYALCCLYVSRQVISNRDKIQARIILFSSTSFYVINHVSFFRFFIRLFFTWSFRP